MENVKLMNMCKIINPKTKEVLVQERIKSWEGIAFPGGKVELGESIVPSVKREIYEETGLKIKNMRICGIKDWCDKKEKKRQLIFLFMSDEFEGELISETSEGKVYWLSEEKLKNQKLAYDFDKVLEVFNKDNINEMIYNDNENLDENLRWDLILY